MYFEATLTRSLVFKSAGSPNRAMEAGTVIRVRYNEGMGRYDAVVTAHGSRYDRLDIPRSAFEAV